MDNYRLRSDTIVEWVLSKLLPGDIVAVEDYGMVGRYSASAKVVERTELLGMLKYALPRRTGIDYLSILPKRLKKFTAGTGNAKKADMVASVNSFFGLDVADHNIADAVGLAVMGFCMLSNNGEIAPMLSDKTFLDNPKRLEVLSLEVARNKIWIDSLIARLEND